MRILTAAFLSKEHLAQHLGPAPDPDGFYYATRMDLALEEIVLCEISFPGLPSRVNVRGQVTGFDATGDGAWITIVPADRTTWDYVARLARGLPVDRIPVPRYYPRFPTEVDVRVAAAETGENRNRWATCTDVGAGGVFVRTPHPVAVGTEVDLALAAGDLGELVVRGTVSWSAPSRGMGIRLDPAEPTTRLLRQSLRRDSERGRLAL